MELPKENVDEDALDQENDIDVKDLKKNIRNFALKTIVEYNIKTFTDTNDIMIYTEGQYVKGEKILQGMFDTEFASYSTGSNFNEFLHFIRSSSFLDRELFISPDNYINLKNCVLDAFTGKIYDHSPNYNFLYKIDTDYDKDAKCPEIERFLHSVISEKDYDCLIELIGNTFISGMYFRNLFVLVGTGSNGKSKFMKLIEKLVGKVNCSNISMQSLSDDKFASSSLYGKKVNICADIPSTSINETGVLKQLTGGDTLMAQQKGKNAYFFVNEAKPIFSCNELPDIKDKTTAMWERIILIEFPNEFKGKNEDKDLLLKITTSSELSGLLNIALVGVKRLLTNKTFSYDFDETMIRWYDYRNARNPLILFIRECIVLDDDKDLSMSDTFQLYKAYCKTMRVVSVSDKMFHIYMRRYLNQEDEYQPSDGHGKQIRSYKGIRVSDKWIKEYKLC